MLHRYSGSCHFKHFFLLFLNVGVCVFLCPEKNDKLAVQKQDNGASSNDHSKPSQKLKIPVTHLYPRVFSFLQRGLLGNSILKVSLS